MSHSSKISCNNSGPRLAYGRPLSWFNLSVVTIRTHPEASQHVYMSEHNSPGCDVCSTTVSEPGTTYPHMDLGVAPGEDAPDQNFCINSGVFTVSGVHTSAYSTSADVTLPIPPSCSPTGSRFYSVRRSVAFCPSFLVRSLTSHPLFHHLPSVSFPLFSLWSIHVPCVVFYSNPHPLSSACP